MNFMILSMSSLFHTFIVNFQNSMTPQVAGVLFIFLWLIVSQLATKLSYRRRLDKVINMMVMMINLITLHCIAMRINFNDNYDQFDDNNDRHDDNDGQLDNNDDQLDNNKDQHDGNYDLHDDNNDQERKGS